MAIWLPELDGRHGPKYLQIVEVMAEDITAGRLAAGTRLLPHRELAYQLGMSANTTSRAYAEAIRRALLRGEVGRGTFVRSPERTQLADEQSNLLRKRKGPIDLSRNLPLPGFAEPHIRRVLAEIAHGDGLPALLDYQTDEDLVYHSEAGKIWLDDCGIEAGFDQIVTTMGGQHGLLCSLMALMGPGDLLLTETLTYTPIRAMAKRLGLYTASIDIDSEGVIPEAFAELCRCAKPKAFYLTPTLQAPTTVTLSRERRQSIAQIAAQYEVILIEDDVFGPLKADRPRPLASFAPEHTIYITSLSKTVAPGLRVGFLHAPPSMIPALRHAINLSVWMTPPMALEVAARLIRDGTARELATRQRNAASSRQSLAQSILGHVNFVADQHGLHLWMPLPDDRRADIFRSHCFRHGVLVSEGRSFAANANNAPEAIRICLSHEPEETRLKQGLQKIANLLRIEPNESTLEI